MSRKTDNPGSGQARGLLRSLAMLFHHRWAAPIMVELHRDAQRAGGSRFIALHARLGMSRETLRATLDALIQAGWIARNPGVGHALRPEYLLTSAGRRIAPTCANVLAALRRLRIERVGLQKWSVPVAAALAHGSQRFNELKRTLPGITARALALALKDLQDAGVIRRNLVDAYPPTAAYELTSRGRAISRALGNWR